MKTMKALTLLLILVLLNTRFSYADGERPEAAPPPDYKQMLYDEIRTFVSYPAFAKEEGIEGFVLISYDYDNTGSLRVLECNTNSLMLKNYVISRLSSIDLCSYARKPGLVYSMRFDFRLI
jgi:hypothetical protein